MSKRNVFVIKSSSLMDAGDFSPEKAVRGEQVAFSCAYCSCYGLMTSLLCRASGPCRFAISMWSWSWSLARPPPAHTLPRANVGNKSLARPLPRPHAPTHQPGGQTGPAGPNAPKPVACQTAPPPTHSHTHNNPHMVSNVRPTDPRPVVGWLHKARFLKNRVSPFTSSTQNVSRPSATFRHHHCFLSWPTPPPPSP